MCFSNDQFDGDYEADTAGFRMRKNDGQDVRGTRDVY